MNRITRMKAVRRGTVAAATIAALVASGAAIAGASGTRPAFNTRSALERTHAHHANHDHGHHGIRQFEGVISSLTGPSGSPTSMVVTTRQNTPVTVDLTASTAVTMEHASGPLTLANLATGEQVNVTPASGSTPTSFVAASVRVQATEVHPIEGVVYSVNAATSMVVTTRDHGSITVWFTPTTLVVTNHTSALLTSTSVVHGERVNVTPAPTSTPTTFVAASVRIQAQDK